MLVTFHCRDCNAKLRINADAMGSDIDCPECNAPMRIPQMSLGPGFVLGGFLIKHKIGQGGMGEVYLAKQLSLERDVALKILPSRFTREKSFLVRFLKEVHYQAKMDHPNIVTAYDAGEDNGVYFMAMAYVPGETLEEWLDREGPMEEMDALQVVRQVGLALQYASEEKGILHRDIKPANVMISPTMHAKVLDMGLSKNTLEKASSTMADTLLGTPNYMSPEQIDHPQDIDFRADLFSLGMTFYHILTGQVPFEDTSYLKTLRRHAEEHLEDPRKLMPGITAGTVRLLARMLAREPDDRYLNWNSFLDDVHGVQSGNRWPELPEGETMLDLMEVAEAPVVLDGQRKGTGLSRSGKRNMRAVAFSVLIGLWLGLVMVIIVGQTNPGMLRQPPSETPMPPTPTPLPSPTPLPQVDDTALRRQLTTIILDYEREPTSHQTTIERLVALATESGDSDVADKAAEEIIRVRREQDQAVKLARQQLREEALRLLYERGVEDARAYLENLDSPYATDLELLRQNLLRRVEIREQQEEEQRQEDTRRAEEAYALLKRKLAPRILNRDWPEIQRILSEATEDPALFPVAPQIALLRKEVGELQAVPGQIRATFEDDLMGDIDLLMVDGPKTVRLLGVTEEGLEVAEVVYDEFGRPQGQAERLIPFNQLSREEVFLRLERFNGPAFDMFRAMMTYQVGDRDVCRQFLQAAATEISKAVEDFIFSPLPLPTPRSTPGEENPEDIFRRPPFDSRPNR